MSLEKVTIRNFRCFEKETLALDERLNWIVGQNASGKTSLLEALFFLGHGRSFRSNRPDRLILEGKEAFEVVAHFRTGKRKSVLGVARDDNRTRARLDGRTLKGMSEAAQALPVVVLDSGMNQLISEGPGERRRWLDWGVFHVEHVFLAVWREYQQALRQRNRVLKDGAADRMLQPWTQAVIQSGGKLADLRQVHFERLRPVLLEYAVRALPGVEVDVLLRRGWSESETLEESLARHLFKDREFGNTRRGPHRADIQFRVSGLPAEERLSRGQQKMLAGAAWLAQVQLFTRLARQSPLLLVDDLAAELDTENLSRFLALLAEQDVQQVLTAINDDDVARTGLVDGRVFHVEQGVFIHHGINPHPGI